VSWLLILAMAVVVALLLVVVLRAPRAGWEAIVAALLVGLAGYALQGHPGLPGAPRVADEAPSASADAMVKARQALSGQDATDNSWMMVADALARHGEFADATSILRGAVEKDPHNGQAWLAMANSLVGHAGGSLAPAAMYAFREAEAADPAAPGPPYFLGLAMARSGQLMEARAQWAGLLARSPANAPWRPDLSQQLGRLDALIAEARKAGAIP
jgi:cytochrome c-type biogenesis protein CcmH